MEVEFKKKYFLTPPDKQNLPSHVLINGRLCDKDSKTRRVQVVQLGAGSDAVIYGNQSSKLTFEAAEFVSDYRRHHLGDEIDGVGLATSTPEKQDSKKRPSSMIHLKSPARKKPKKHKPKILDENSKQKTRNGQASDFIPKTPLKCSTRTQRSKKRYVKKNISEEVSVKDTIERVINSSTHVVQGNLQYSSCRQSLRFLEKETEVENVYNPSKVCEGQLLNINFDIKEEKRFTKCYQRRGSVKMGDSGVHMGMTTISETREPIQNTRSSGRLVSEIFETDCLASLRSGCSNISPFPELYKRRRNVRHLLNKRLDERRMNDCVKSLPSCPLEWRKKRSACTKRRIYASRPIKFKCSSSSSVNLLEHLIDEKRHDKLANKKKKIRKRREKVKPSSKKEIVKMIKEYLSQECLLQKKDLDMHSFVAFIAKFESLSIHNKYDQLVVRDQSVGASIVPYEGKINPPKKKKSKKRKKALVKVDLDEESEGARDQGVGASIVQYKGKINRSKKSKALVKVDLDEETERAWLKFLDDCGNSYEQGSENEEYWERERQVMTNRAMCTISILASFQGNRSFSRWKGSVMDSIIGTFLTQNVTDHLSSSAFMHVVARFPGRDSKRSNVSACLPLDMSPNEVVGMQSCGNKSTFHEINHRASIIQTECPVICASIIDSQDNNFQSVRRKGDSRKNKINKKKTGEHSKNWDNLRERYGRSRERNDDNMDAVNWEAIRKATIDEFADTIKGRGQHNILARKIKAFLDRVMRDHGSMDLEWLRDVPPQDAKDYLLSIHGIGLKSTECIRLLTLHHVAFPVDVNVARVTVRLGWVPLQPLPGGLEMHLLKEYPVMDDIQKYLYPRLCTLNHETLYELHYHLITFGKIFCTKNKPRCDGCPLSGQCKHYASLSASKRLALHAPEIKKKSNVEDKPIVEMPDSPENHIAEYELLDIEDFYQDHNVALPDLNETHDRHESDDKSIIRLDNEESNNQIEISIHGRNKSLLVAQRVPWAIPVPNYRGRLKSVHQVYELPDSHQILQQLQVDERDPNDPSPYLFVPWVVHEQDGKPRSSFPQGCSSSEVCRDIVCCSSFSNNENDFATTVSGTLMIPVRTANIGRFALNGTYFQVNEVFADDESTNVPINVPTQCLSNLPLTLLFCGANVTSAFRGLPMEWIHGAFNRGYFCNRGFNRETRGTTKLSKLFHIKTNSQGKKTRETKEEKTKQSDVA